MLIGINVGISRAVSKKTQINMYRISHRLHSKTHLAPIQHEDIELQFTAQKLPHCLKCFPDKCSMC